METDYSLARHTARRIAEEVAAAGGRTYYVGGCVRDRLRGLGADDIDDVDIEVYGITPAALEAILNGISPYRKVGLAFGIYSLPGHLDVAMPRREKATGRGHRDFAVYVDPDLSPQKAARRRDLTINALMEDVLSGEVLDFFGGLADMQDGVLRHIDSETFVEDPLRVFRVAQFAARFSYRVAPETLALCREMDVRPLAAERVQAEMEKALRQAPRPSLFFETLREMDRLGEWFPELRALIGVPQNPSFHPEGDVWTHTMLVLDETARLWDEAAGQDRPACADRTSANCAATETVTDRQASDSIGTEYRGGMAHQREETARREGDEASGRDDQILQKDDEVSRPRQAVPSLTTPGQGDAAERAANNHDAVPPGQGRPANSSDAAPAGRIPLLLAALCHDLGKADTTAVGDDGCLHAYGHEESGVTRTHALLSRLRLPKRTTSYVENMVLLHMRPNMLAAAHAKEKSTNRLFDRALDPEGLLLLAKADALGQQTAESAAFLRERLEAYRRRMAEPQVCAADLMRAGVTPGPALGEALAYAHKLHLSGVDKAAALRQTLASMQEYSRGSPLHRIFLQPR